MRRRRHAWRRVIQFNASVIRDASHIENFEVQRRIFGGLGEIRHFFCRDGPGWLSQPVETQPAWIEWFTTFTTQPPDYSIGR